MCEDLDANEAVAAAAAPAPVTEQQQQEGQQQGPGASTAQGGGVQGPPRRRPGQGPLLAGVLDVEAAVGRDAAASRCVCASWPPALRLRRTCAWPGECRLWHVFGILLGHDHA